MSVRIEEEEDFGPCPSFNYYSTNGVVAETANRVSREESDEDFQFVSLQNMNYSLFPIFNSDLLFEEGEEIDDRDHIRIPLETLIIGDRESEFPSPSSSSSSEIDEADGVPRGTYCFWKPKFVEKQNVTCKKSRSTGSSSTNRWRIRDFLRRSHSDGKNSYISFTPFSVSNSTEGSKTEKLGKNLKEKKIGGGGKVAGEKKVLSAHESFYVRNRKMREEGKRKSYLPYKQDLVGFWTNFSGLGKISSPIRHS